MKLSLLLLVVCALAQAQFYNIATVAGNGLKPFGSGGPATSAALEQPRAAVVDSAGNVYISDTYFHQVFKINTSGTISAYAGNGSLGFSGDSGPAASAQLNGPIGLAIDSSDNLYIADTGNSRVRVVSSSGTIKTLAVVATGVGFVASDGKGNLYATGGQIIVKIDSAGNVSPFAGNGKAGFSGDNGPAISASLYSPYGLRVDASGNVYVADSGNNRIRKINTQGVITTFAGNGQGALAGENGAATSASLFLPSDVALDSAGNVYIADTGNNRIRLVNSSGTINTLAGGGGVLTDGAALQVALYPFTVAIDKNGNVLTVETGLRRVRQIANQAQVTTIAGQLAGGTAGDGGPATSTSLLAPIGVAVDPPGNLYVSDYLDNRLRKITPAGIISTVAGNGIPGYAASGQAVSAEVDEPLGLSVDPSGNLLTLTAGVQEIKTDGTLATLTSPAQGFSGDGGPATSAATLGAADAVADFSGNIYISDRGNNRIRKINPIGAISTIAGDGTPAATGDGGPAASAELFQPWQLAVDKNNNLFIADWGNSRVRKVDKNGVITTVAGGGSAFPGDGGPATAANILSNLFGVAVDGSGNLYITSNARIRKVDGVTGIISTIAGTGTAGFTGDGGLATNAQINGAQNIAVDTAGNVYFADANNLRVRKLTPVQIVREGILNGATFQTGGISPGEIITIYGGPDVTLGPSTAAGLQLDSTGKVATQLGGTQVMIGGVAAALIYVSATQINVVVPYEVAGQTSTQLQVVVQGKPTNTVTLPVAPSSPGVFAITNPDGSVNAPSNPVASTGYLVLYGTGEGQTTPAGVDGGVNSATYPKPNLPVTVQIGGQPASILYAGAAPGFVAGVLQIDVQIPQGVTGTVPIQVTIGTASTPAGLNVTVH